MGCFRTLFPFRKGGKSKKAAAENQPLLEPLSADEAPDTQDPHVGELTEAPANGHADEQAVMVAAPSRDELPGTFPDQNGAQTELGTDSCPLHSSEPPPPDKICCGCCGCSSSILCCFPCPFLLKCNTSCPCCCGGKKKQDVIESEAEASENENTGVPAIVQTVTTETVTETVVNAVPIAHEVEATEAGQSEPLLPMPPTALRSTAA